MSSPKVSVISIAYNHSRFVDQAIESVLNQVVDFDIEIIVSDDCSTDDTQSKLIEWSKRFPGRMTLVLRETNVGAATNFRDTYHMAKGEYIAILECDDYWTDSYKLKKQVELLDKAKDCSLCFHATRYVDESGKATGWIHPERRKDFWQLEDIVSENPVQTCSILLRRSCVPCLPEFFLKLKLGDWPLCILAARQGAIAFDQEIMASYRVHAAGVWSGLALSKKLAAQSSMYLRLAIEFPDLVPLIESALSEQIERLAIESMEVHRLRATRTWKLGSLLVSPVLWIRRLFGKS